MGSSDEYKSAEVKYEENAQFAESPFPERNHRLPDCGNAGNGDGGVYT